VECIEFGAGFMGFISTTERQVKFVCDQITNNSPLHQAVKENGKINLLGFSHGSFLLRALLQTCP